LPLGGRFPRRRRIIIIIIIIIIKKCNALKITFLKKKHQNELLKKLGMEVSCPQAASFLSV